jgi:hypothetical protein
MLESGARMPLDPDPVDDGTIKLVDDRGEGRAIVLPVSARDMARSDGVPLYRSHYATCPDAALHRKR